MIVKPTSPDAIIRDPHTRRRLPAGGGQVPDSSFWRRRLRDGDVVRTVLPKPKATPKPAQEAKPS